MTGLFERAIGEEWSTLHPQVRERYGVESSDGREAVGVGQMDELTRSPLAVPALWLGTFDDFLFPESGTDVRFSIVTEPFVDGNGNEALRLERRFDTSPPRTFVDTLRWNPARGCIVDLFGTRGLVGADLHAAADDGALALSIGTQYLRVGGRSLALPALLSARGRLTDWYDEDDECFRVEADIENPLVGSVFGYEGGFESEFRSADGDPADRPPLADVRLPGERP
ncbi:DUF4166 domain-containing protein [Natrialba sp. INN-245]|uniref:DUF4166 domain-containing protein n=1 Tax=Natrialba sp. INN-245 TaxID=2690967 RepID=UPI001312799C|nr:DUF4166 domain-containing protein [Natrialba sp. INN-245]